MRRRSKTPQGIEWDGAVPDWTLVFRAEDWPGNYPWMQWDAWWTAVQEWADANMPAGSDELVRIMSELPGGVPDRPWNPNVI